VTFSLPHLYLLVGSGVIRTVTRDILPVLRLRTTRIPLRGYSPFGSPTPHRFRTAALPFARRTTAFAYTPFLHYFAVTPSLITLWIVHYLPPQFQLLPTVTFSFSSQLILRHVTVDITWLCLVGLHCHTRCYILPFGYLRYIHTFHTFVVTFIPVGSVVHCAFYIHTLLLYILHTHIYFVHVAATWHTYACALVVLLIINNNK